MIWKIVWTCLRNVDRRTTEISTLYKYKQGKFTTTPWVPAEIVLGIPKSFSILHGRTPKPWIHITRLNGNLQLLLIWFLALPVNITSISKWRILQLSTKYLRSIFARYSTTSFFLCLFGQVFPGPNSQQYFPHHASLFLRL